MMKEKNATLLILTLSLLTLAHWMILALKIPVLQALPYWFFGLRETSVNPLWILAALILLVAAAIIVFSEIKISVKLTALILLGAGIQFSFAFSKGQGLNAIAERMSGVGHAIFAQTAVEQPSMWNVARNYESMIENNEIPGAYLRSKPPGTLLFYMLTERLANIAAPDAAPETRLDNLRRFASVAWTLCAYLVLIPLFFLARGMFDEETALIACLLFLCIPSLILITMHTDQAVYPLLAMAPVLLIHLACEKKNFPLAFFGGVVFYLAVFFSFGLAMIALMIALPFLIRLPAESFKNLKTILIQAGIALLGVIASDILARIILRYDIFLRYTNAMQFHVKWKEWEGGAANTLRAGLTATTEFFTWMGLPLTVLFFIAIGYSLHQIFINRKADTSSLFTLALALTFDLLLLFGKTKAETARLWLFLVPFVCLSAARLIQEFDWTRKSKIAFLAYILLLEFGSIYFILRHQDFL